MPSPPDFGNSKIDFPIVDVGQDLQASKHREWREFIFLSRRALVRFLDEHQLLLDSQQIPDGHYSEDLVINFSDLNALGQAVIWDGLRKWHNNISKGRNPESVVSLERALKRVLARRH